MTKLWYDIESPHCRYAVGQIEVEHGKIVAATNSYRWTIGMYFDDFNAQQFKKGYHVALRYEPWAKNISTGPSTYKKPRPSDRELHRRLAP